MHFCPDELGPIMQLLDLAQQWLLIVLRLIVDCGKKVWLYPHTKRKNEQTIKDFKRRKRTKLKVMV